MRNNSVTLTNIKYLRLISTYTQACAHTHTKVFSEGACVYMKTRHIQIGVDIHYKKPQDVGLQCDMTFCLSYKCSGLLDSRASKCI